MSDASTRDESIAFEKPRLLADIGGTYARFTLETAPGKFEFQRSLLCADHADFHAAITHYLSDLPAGRIRNAAIAIANPVTGDQVRMTNYHWQFSIEEMRVRLDFDNLLVVNDFTALAMSLPKLLPQHRRQIGGGKQVPNSVMGVIGAGTGLGVSGLIPAAGGWIALGSEGGHTSFSPRNEREIAIMQYAWKELGHVSFERFLSGPGLELIYQALSDVTKKKNKQLTAPEITKHALDGSDPLCVQTVECFCEMLGTAAANVALTHGALGGIFIGGGIVPRLGEMFDHSKFRERFEDKGRFSDFLREIPTFVITESRATYMGLSLILSNQLEGMQNASGSSILTQIQRVRPELSPAEQRVADLILRHPRAALNDPIAKLAKAADVSQPTVIRFCRSLGCDGLSDFKLRLASGLTGTMPVTHAQVTRDDSVLELGDKVLANTASAILQVRSHLNSKAIDQAVRSINEARRVEFYAVGHFGSVAEDAQFKFLRMGISAISYTAPRLQLLAANVLESDVVVVVISGSGQISELMDVVQKAKERGATVVAITASQSQLSRSADISLIVDNFEEASTQVPMISRILHLLMVDILVVGVAMQRGLQQAPPLSVKVELDELQPISGEKRPENLASEKPGVYLSSDLAHLTAQPRSKKQH
jgi:glucokinase